MYNVFYQDCKLNEFTAACFIRRTCDVIESDERFRAGWIDDSVTVTQYLYIVLDATPTFHMMEFVVNSS